MQGGAPHPAIRISKTKSGSTITTKASTLHRDALGSVRAVTTAAGLAAERATCPPLTLRAFGADVPPLEGRPGAPHPYGEQTEAVFGVATAPETKGFIGEHFDADAGLQYLNARYYDPKLGMFLQPDWWEVTQAGVGTNRYGYSFGDPVNGRDPSGHACDVMGACGLPGEDIPGFDFDPTKNMAIVMGMAGLLVVPALPEIVAGLAVRSGPAWEFGTAVAAGEVGAVVPGGAAVGGGALALAGGWKKVNESMSARALAYQISQGGKAGQAFVVNGTKFDGVSRAGVLIETKGPGYSWAVQNGKFRDGYKGAEEMVEQAIRQVKAARGTPVEWRFAEKATAAAAESMFKERGIQGIRIIYTGGSDRSGSATGGASGGPSLGDLFRSIGRALGLVK